MRRRGGLILLLTVLASIARAAVPQSTEIRGAVIDSQTSQPIRHASVTLVSAAAPPQSRTVSTDDLGRFVFLRVNAGRYSMSVVAPSYLSADDRGAFDVSAGARLSNLVIPLTRTAAIGGVVLDRSGDPLVDASIRVLRRGYSRAGRRTLVDAEIGGVTDDRGRYRIRGLAPGEYFVASDGEKLSAEGSGSNADRSQGVTVLRHADILAARRGGAPIAAAPATPPSVTANTYYPGVTSASDAVSIVLRAGDERTDIDFTLRSDPVATIEGTVVMPAGIDPERLELELQERDFTRFRHFTVTIDREGFEIERVPPGEYVLSGFVRTRDRPLFGSTTVSVNGRDLSGVRLQMLPGATISGRVGFTGASPAPEVREAIRIALTQVSSITQSEGAPPAAIDATGAFVFSGVPPGRYVLEPSTSGIGSWLVTSAIVGGRNVTDAPFDVQSGTTIADVTLTLSNQWAALSGRVTSAGATPASRYVVMWPTDRAAWRAYSRRIVSVPVAADGAYRFSRLPSGEYFVAVTGELEPGQLFSAGFLDQLVATSPMRITLAVGEKKTQDLQIR